MGSIESKQTPLPGMYTTCINQLAVIIKRLGASLLCILHKYVLFRDLSLEKRKSVSKQIDRVVLYRSPKKIEGSGAADPEFGGHLAEDNKAEPYLSPC